MSYVPDEENFEVEGIFDPSLFEFNNYAIPFDGLDIEPQYLGNADPTLPSGPSSRSTSDNDRQTSNAECQSSVLSTENRQNSTITEGDKSDRLVLSRAFSNLDPQLPQNSTDGTANGPFIIPATLDNIAVGEAFDSSLSNLGLAGQYDPLTTMENGQNQFVDPAQTNQLTCDSMNVRTEFVTGSTSNVTDARLSFDFAHVVQGSECLPPLSFNLGLGDQFSSESQLLNSDSFLLGSASGFSFHESQGTVALLREFDEFFSNSVPFVHGSTTVQGDPGTQITTLDDNEIEHRVTFHLPTSQLVLPTVCDKATSTREDGEVAGENPSQDAVRQIARPSEPLQFVFALNPKARDILEQELTVKPKRTRRILKKIEKGNNLSGRKGLERCAECRKRRSKCIFVNRWRPCEYCQKHYVRNPCFKLWGPSKEYKVEPSRPPPSPMDAVIGPDEVLLLQSIYVQDPGNSESCSTGLFSRQLLKMCASIFGLSICNSSLRYTMLAVAEAFLDRAEVDDRIELYVTKAMKAICHKKPHEWDEGEGLSAFFLLILDSKHSDHRQYRRVSHTRLFVSVIKRLCHERSTGWDLLSNYLPILLTWITPDLVDNPHVSDLSKILIALLSQFSSFMEFRNLTRSVQDVLRPSKIAQYSICRAACYFIHSIGNKLRRILYDTAMRQRNGYSGQDIGSTVFIDVFKASSESREFKEYLAGLDLSVGNEQCVYHEYLVCRVLVVLIEARTIVSAHKAPDFIDVCEDLLGFMTRNLSPPANMEMCVSNDMLLTASLCLVGLAVGLSAQNAQNVELGTSSEWSIRQLKERGEADLAQIIEKYRVNPDIQEFCNLLNIWCARSEWKEYFLGCFGF